MGFGISYDDFQNSTPNEVSIMIEGAQEREKHMNILNWINGMYMASAIQSTVGNMFKKKGTDPNKYMDKPLPLYETDEEPTEEEKITEEQRLLLSLQSMQRAFEANKK